MPRPYVTGVVEAVMQKTAVCKRDFTGNRIINGDGIEQFLQQKNK